MARLFRQHDWSDSPLGPPEQWPQSLRSVVQLMLGSAFPMFVAWGPKLALVYNVGYADLIGIKHPAALGQPLFDVWHEIEGDLLPLVKRAMSGESFFMESLPLRLRRRGFDEDAWFTFSYSPVLDDAGSIAGVYCACTETTSMVLAERKQRAERERLQSLFSQAPGFLAVMRGPQHVFESANLAFMQTIGSRDIIGKSVAEALPEVVEQGFTRLLDKVYTTGQPFVWRSLRMLVNREQGAPLTEAYVDLVYQPLTDAAGAVDGILVQVHEVTEQHRAQEALLMFSNSIPAIAWVALPDGTVERFNSQLEACTGQATDSAIGHGWVQALHPDDRGAARQAWEKARTGHVPWNVEYRLRQHDGTFRWFYVRCVPQFDAFGQVMRWFGTTTDRGRPAGRAGATRRRPSERPVFGHAGA